jgi:hypothetical protein
VEQACSNIAKPRIGDDHTCTWTRARLGMRWVRRPSSTSLPAASCDNLDSYTLPECRRLWGTDRTGTTCHLPLNRVVGNAFTCPYVPGHHARLHRNYPSAHRESNPTDQQVKDLGTPEGMMNHHLNINLFLCIYIAWNIKHKVLHVKLIT